MNATDLLPVFGNPGGNLELALKIISGVVGIIGVAVALYVALTTRRWKKDKEREDDKQKNRELTIDSKIADAKASLKEDITVLATSVSNYALRIQRLEESLQGSANLDSMRSLKFTLETDLSELKANLTRFKDSCTSRHEQLAAHGSLSDLKARVDEVVSKISSLEDFRHASADRYVLMRNYQQDVRMLTDAIAMLREDLRAVMEMVDNL